MESKCKYYNEEAEHQQGHVNDTDGLPAAEPYLTVDADRLHGTPEAVRKVEPQGSEPDDVENDIHRIGESCLDVLETMRGRYLDRHPRQFCKHHVVPEVEKVKPDAQQHDNTENEHVLACPLHACRLLRHGITVVTARTAVLRRQDERIDDVTDSQCPQCHGSHDGIPVGPQQLADHVVGFSGEERDKVHTAVERHE